MLGMNHYSDRDISSLENRRETKQERDARRLERERVVRAKERERSMKEESVDGGYLVTQGVYTGTEDFNKAIVRRLMVGNRSVSLKDNKNLLPLTWIHRLRDAWPPFSKESMIIHPVGGMTS